MKYIVRFYRGDPESQVSSSDHRHVGTFRSVKAAATFLKNEGYILVGCHDDNGRHLKVADRNPLGRWKKRGRSIRFYADIHPLESPSRK